MENARPSSHVASSKFTQQEPESACGLQPTGNVSENQVFAVLGARLLGVVCYCSFTQGKWTSAVSNLEVLGLSVSTVGSSRSFFCQQTACLFKNQIWLYPLGIFWWQFPENPIQQAQKFISLFNWQVKDRFSSTLSRGAVLSPGLYVSPSLDSAFPFLASFSGFVW